MSTAEAHTASPDARVGKVDTKLEVDVIPVSDVDRCQAVLRTPGLEAGR